MKALIDKTTLYTIVMRLKVSSDYLSKKCHIDESDIDDFLDVNNDRLPSFGQAKKIAKELHVPFALLYMDVSLLPIDKLPKKLSNFRSGVDSIDDSIVNLAIFDLLNDKTRYLNVCQMIEEPSMRYEHAIRYAKVSDIEKSVEEIKDKASQSEKNVSGIEDKVKSIQDQITELAKSYTETVAAKEALEKELASYQRQFFDAEKYRVPTPTTLKKLKAGKKKITVTWNRQTDHTNGYDIQYSLKKNFSVSVKTKTIKKNTTTKLTLKKLKAKKKYYVRIRTYKTIDGKKYYSDWSKKKAVKTK